MVRDPSAVRPSLSLGQYTLQRGVWLTRSAPRMSKYRQQKLMHRAVKVVRNFAELWQRLMVWRSLNRWRAHGGCDPGTFC